MVSLEINPIKMENRVLGGERLAGTRGRFCLESVIKMPQEVFRTHSSSSYFGEEIKASQ